MTDREALARALRERFWAVYPDGAKFDSDAISVAAALADAGYTLVKVADERAYVNAYIEGRDSGLREALIERVGDMVGRQAAADVVDAAFRAAVETDSAATRMDEAMG